MPWCSSAGVGSVKQCATFEWVSVENHAKVGSMAT
jgi:hypothetical protein